MKILVSVRSVAEARLAVAGGADFIDLKDPRRGALGGLPVACIAPIVAALRGGGARQPISATIGDLPARRRSAIQARVQAVGATGVDFVKVGITRGPDAPALLRWLAHCGWPVVPVFIADEGLDPAQIDLASELRFPALMLDTADKRAGCLFDRLDGRALAAFVEQVRRSGAMAGLAGALRLAHLESLVRLAPDFAGFRSAVCSGGRGNALEASKLRALTDGAAAARRRLQPARDEASPSSIDRTRASSLP